MRSSRLKCLSWLKSTLNKGFRVFYRIRHQVEMKKVWLIMCFIVDYCCALLVACGKVKLG